MSFSLSLFTGKQHSSDDTTSEISGKLQSSNNIHYVKTQVNKKCNKKGSKKYKKSS